MHQGNIQIVGGTNVGVVSKNGVVTLTATDTTYTTSTLAQLNAGAHTVSQLHTAKLLNDWINPKLALKASLTDISTAIDSIEIGGRNLIIRSSEEVGTWIDATGSIVTALNHSTTDYIKIEPSKTYSLSKIPSVLVTEGIGGYWRYAWYDENKVYISRAAETSLHNLQGTLPSNAHYVRLSYPIDSQPKFEKGIKVTDWTPAPEDQISDWNTTDEASFRYIKNKPTTLAGYGITDIVTLNTAQTITGVKTFTGNLTAGNITPLATVAHNIGTSSLMYETAYIRRIDTQSGYHLRFNVAGSEYMTITTSGDVGIGTTSPAYKLDVAGTGRFTGNVTAPTFVGALSGNATSASSINVPPTEGTLGLRTINLGGYGVLWPYGTSLTAIRTGIGFGWRDTE